MTHSYSVSGMTCSGCQAKVQHILSTIKGVKNISIDLQNGEAEIEMETHIPTTELQAALKDYPKYQLSEKKVFEEKIVTEKRNYSLRLSGSRF